MLHLGVFMTANGTDATRSQVHATLILMRHGESVWNRSMRLTGWADVALNERGREQARQAGLALKERGLTPDACYSSRLGRAVETLDIVLDTLGSTLARKQSWRINERHYGALQGLYWWQAVLRFGVGPVLRCRWQADFRPPLSEDAPGSGADEIDAEEAEEWQRAQRGESLADALERFLPLWKTEISPALSAGSCLLIVAHNNLLRGLIGYLADGDGEPAPPLATGKPWVLQLDRDLRVLDRTAV